MMIWVESVPAEFMNILRPLYTLMFVSGNGDDANSSYLQ